MQSSSHLLDEARDRLCLYPADVGYQVRKLICCAIPAERLNSSRIPSHKALPRRTPEKSETENQNYDHRDRGARRGQDVSIHRCSSPGAVSAGLP